MIKVKVNLYAELTKYLNGKKETFLEIEDSYDIRHVIAKLGIPYEEVSMCIVNNIPVSKEKMLTNDDTLKLIPPITGG